MSRNGSDSGIRDEDHDMESDLLPSSLNSAFLGEMSTLDLLSSQEMMLSDNDDPKQVSKQLSNSEKNVKSSDAAPSHTIGAGPSSNTKKISSFSVLSKSKSKNDRKNKKKAYEFVLPNNNVNNQHKSRKDDNNNNNNNDNNNNVVEIKSSKLLPNLSQIKQISTPEEIVSKPKRGRKKNVINVDNAKGIDYNLSKSNDGIFSNLRILFIPNNIDKIRLNLMKSKVIDKGGIVEEKFEVDKNITHIITELNGKQAISMLGVRKLKSFENISIVKPDWISESIMYGKLRDVKPFTVPLTEESNNNSNVASNSQSQNLKRSHDEGKAEKQETNLENVETPDKKRRVMPPQDLDSKLVQKDESSLESLELNNDNNDNNDTVPIDTPCNMDSNDPLSEIIAETKRLVEAGLYVEDEGDDGNESTPDSNEEVENLSEGETITDFDNSEENSDKPDEHTDNNNAESSSSFKAKSFRGQNSFVCMHSHSYGETDNNPNKLIIEKLQVLLDHYTRMKDEWRILSYRKAISAIKKYTKPITSYEEAKKIPGIGLRTAEKIAEIIDTGNLKRINNFSEGDDIIKKFGNVYGVGPTIAMKWYTKGYRTFEDVLKSEDLTRNQITGILHFEDLQKRIPRDEVTEISEWVKCAAISIDPKLECTTGGSYRRGSPDCGDIDIIITRNDSDGTTHLGVLPKLVEILRNQGFLTHELVQHNGDSLSAKFMGICKLPEGLHRRLDLFMVPYNEMGAALLSYTGNDIFNRSMRLMARKRKMCLNQHGLFVNVSRGRDGVKYSGGKLVAQRTEREMFDALGVPWRPPNERNC